MDHGGAGDESGTKSRFGNVAGAAGGKKRDWNQPFSIREQETKASLDSSADWEWLGNSRTDSPEQR